MTQDEVFGYFQKRYKRGIYKNMSGPLATAAALGITHQAVYSWKGRVPPRTQILIELLTKSKLKRAIA